MVLTDTNIYILIPYPYSPGGYQEKYENWEFRKEIMFWGVEMKITKMRTCGAHKSSNN